MTTISDPGAGRARAAKPRAGTAGRKTARLDAGQARTGKRADPPGARKGRVAAMAGLTHTERLHRDLEAAIATGHLEPGSRLDEQEVALRYGVSRTPVREAFRLLAASNLVELRGRQGAVVRVIGAHDLIEMFQVMAELEGLCARLAARRVPRGWADRIGEIHGRLVDLAQGQDIDAFYDANQDFHEAIYEASRNAYLAEQTRALRNRVAAYRRRVTRMPNRMIATLDEHEAITRAILAHDAEGAHRAMRDHVNLLGDDLLDFIAAFE